MALRLKNKREKGETVFFIIFNHNTCAMAMINDLFTACLLLWGCAELRQGRVRVQTLSSTAFDTAYWLWMVVSISSLKREQKKRGVNIQFWICCCPFFFLLLLLPDGLICALTLQGPGLVGYVTLGRMSIWWLNYERPTRATTRLLDYKLY